MICGDYDYGTTAGTTTYEDGYTVSTATTFYMPGDIIRVGDCEHHITDVYESTLTLNRKIVVNASEEMLERLLELELVEFNDYTFFSVATSDAQRINKRRLPDSFL